MTCSVSNDNVGVEEIEMAEKKRKRIHNPKTRKFYALRQYTTKKGAKGTIKGVWTPPKPPEKRKKKK